MGGRKRSRGILIYDEMHNPSGAQIAQRLPMLWLPPESSFLVEGYSTVNSSMQIDNLDNLGCQVVHFIIIWRSKRNSVARCQHICS